MAIGNSVRKIRAGWCGSPLMARQVRDVLFIDDLLDANEAAFRRADAAVGRAYNIGGGPGNALSLLELVEFLENRRGREPVC